MNDTASHCVRGDLVGTFGIAVQGVLGFVAFSTLLIKRWREPKGERRTWTIWFYDTSKQGLGALFIHFANVFLSDVVTTDDPCTWYLISFLLDSTIGLLLIYLGLTITRKIIRYYNCVSLFFGEYGNPPSCNAWLGQCSIYLVVMFIEKVLVGLMVLPAFWVSVRRIMLSWIANPYIEVVVVMLIVPFFVNALMFWVVDSILMYKNTSKRYVGGTFIYKKNLPYPEDYELSKSGSYIKNEDCRYCETSPDMSSQDDPDAGEDELLLKFDHKDLDFNNSNPKILHLP